jgi:hypothetical protein
VQATPSNSNAEAMAVAEASLAIALEREAGFPALLDRLHEEARRAAAEGKPDEHAAALTRLENAQQLKHTLSTMRAQMQESLAAMKEALKQQQEQSGGVATDPRSNTRVAGAIDADKADPQALKNRIDNERRSMLEVSWTGTTRRAAWLQASVPVVVVWGGGGGDGGMGGCGGG